VQLAVREKQEQPWTLDPTFLPFNARHDGASLHEFLPSYQDVLAIMFAIVFAPFVHSSSQVEVVVLLCSTSNTIAVAHTLPYVVVL